MIEDNEFISEKPPFETMVAIYTKADECKNAVKSLAEEHEVFKDDVLQRAKCLLELAQTLHQLVHRAVIEDLENCFNLEGYQK